MEAKSAVINSVIQGIYCRYLLSIGCCAVVKSLDASVGAYVEQPRNRIGREAVKRLGVVHAKPPYCSAESSFDGGGKLQGAVVCHGFLLRKYAVYNVWK